MIQEKAPAIAPAIARSAPTTVATRDRVVPGSTNRNPPELSLFSLLREDFRTHGRNPFEQGFWAIALHRLGNKRMDIRPKLLRIPFSLLYFAAFKIVEWMCGISLPYTVKLGRRVRIWHHGGMILNAKSIGNDVQIRQTTTMGISSISQIGAVPTIGDRVDIGCHVCILGSITVGDDAVIGAGAVVVNDIPPGATAVGVPARVIKESCRAETADKPQHTKPPEAAG